MTFQKQILNFTFKQRYSRYLCSILIFAFAVISFISLKILHNFPNSADEYAYVFQAKNLARFQTHHTLHPPNEYGERIQNYFYLVHIGHTDGKYYGRFPFGYSLFMVPFAWLESISGLKAYWLTNVFFGVLTIFLLFQFGKRFFNTRVGILASLMGLMSSWFLLNSGSYFSHTINAFFIGLFLYFFCNALSKIDLDNDGTRHYFMLSGFSFGLAVVTRFLDPIPYLLILFILYFGWQRKIDKTIYKHIAYFILGGVFWLIMLLLYNFDLTGNPLQTAYEYYNPNDQSTRFIFQVPQEDGSTSVQFNRIYDVGFLQRTIPNVKLLFEWHIWTWLLVLAPFVFYFNLTAKGGKSILIACIVAIFLVILIYMLYGGPPANQYGPRYYYSLFIPLTLTCAALLDSFLKEDRLIVITMVLLGSLSLKNITHHAMEAEKRVYERTNLFRTIDELEIKNAIVFLKTRSGSIHQVDLPRNSLDFDDSVLIAQDNGNYGGSADYGALIRAYPNREFYEYYYRGKGKLGELKPIWTDVSGQWGYVEPMFSKNNVLVGAEGVIGQYFVGKNFETLTYQRLDKAISFDWGRNAPFPDVTHNFFSIRWEGLFNANTAGEYTFTSTSDDGVKLILNEQEIINNWHPHSVLTESKTLFLDKGKHYILIEYFDDIMEAEIKIEVQGPNLEKQILGAELLTPIIKSAKK